MIDYEKITKACDERITDILDRLNIEYRIEHSWVCLRCPFHGGDKFNLKYRHGDFYCFSECREKYSIIDVVAKTQNMSTGQAAQWLADYVGLSRDGIEIHRDQAVVAGQKIINQCKAIRRKKSDMQPLPQEYLNDIQFPYYDRYISDWGISRETAREFNLGLGLNGDLDGRICFPIDAPDGTIISVSGRLPNADKVGKGKYYIIGKTDAHHTLYNISRAKDYAKRLGFIILVEGMKAVMFLYQNGYKNVVGAMGASVTDEQSKLLLKIGVPIVVIGDNDPAGKRLEQSTYNKLYKYLDVRKVNMGEFTDKEKASVDDLDFDEFVDFEESLNEIKKNYCAEGTIDIQDTEH